MCYTAHVDAYTLACDGTSTVMCIYMYYVPSIVTAMLYTCRNQRLEHKLLMMAHKYQQLKAHLMQSNHTLCSPLTARCHATPPNNVCTLLSDLRSVCCILYIYTTCWFTDSGSPPTLHVQSAYYSPQTQRTHRGSTTDSSAASQRPSSAQGTRDSVSSVETCV